MINYNFESFEGVWFYLNFIIVVNVEIGDVDL